MDAFSETDDTQILKNILENLEDGQIIDCRDNGTGFRFLCALLAIQKGKTFFLTGSPRLMERPIVQLIEALQKLGADLSFSRLADKRIALQIKGKVLQGGEIEMRNPVSSQFVSALCLIAPTLPLGLRIYTNNDINSRPYVDMTLGLMQKFGVSIHTEDTEIYIPHQAYQPRDYRVENDWSSAVFFYCAALLSGEADLTLKDLSINSLQGDVGIVPIAEQMGIHTVQAGTDVLLKKSTDKGSRHFNLKPFPDLAIPLLVTCALKFPDTRFSGLSHLRFKESNRILALREELLKLGIYLDEQYGEIRFERRETPDRSGVYHFSSHHDHRIAMSFYMLKVMGFKIELDDTDCISKSFPHFIAEFDQILE